MQRRPDSYRRTILAVDFAPFLVDSHDSVGVAFDAVKLHPDMRIHTGRFGLEKAPLLVIEDFLADPEELVQIASAQRFTEHARYFPGIRATAPQEYREVFAAGLQGTIAEHFDLSGEISFSLCAFSLITTPADQLTVPQRIPHVDSLAGSGLACIHYLFKRNLGGTAFYRHRKTGFEFVDEQRSATYLQSLDAEDVRPENWGRGYINGDSVLFEQIARSEGIFNRLLVYRRNSLHSGCIAADFVPDANPASGRLSINGFLELGGAANTLSQ